MRRLVAAHCSVPMKDIKNGMLTEGDCKKIMAFSMQQQKAPFYFLDCVSGIDVSRLCSAIRRFVRQYSVQLVVIDYLQKVQPSSKNEKKTYEIAQVSTMLKAVATQTGVAMLTMAQLNRESEKDKGRTPKLSDLAESSQIERDADVVGLIHRNRGDTEGETKIIIAKQRDGELGCVNLLFNGKYARFDNAAKQLD